jgi:hypothetical protein
MKNVFETANLGQSTSFWTFSTQNKTHPLLDFFHSKRFFKKVQKTHFYFFLFLCVFSRKVQVKCQGNTSR